MKKNLNSTAIVLVVALVLLSSCGNPTIENTSEQKRNSETTQQSRKFYPNQQTNTDYRYEDKLGSSTTWYRMMKIATSAETKFAASNKLIHRSTLVAMDYKDKPQNEMTLTFKSEYLKDNGVVFTFDVVRDFSSCTVNSVTLEGKYRSVYTYPNGRRDLPLITTTDLSSGKTVSETKNIEIVGDGSFRVEEFNYQDGKEIFRSVVRRHAGTGMFVEEVVKHGKLDTDYHHYELLLGNWSIGRG